MKITILSASARRGSQSRKVSEYLASRLGEMEADAKVFDFGELKLPSFDAENAPNEQVLEILQRLEASDGAILVSPEWDGMMSHELINFYHYLQQQLADKPVLLVGVSATPRGGQYPVEQMSMMGIKNRHFVIIPGRLVVESVNDVMNDQNLSDDAPDIYIKKRADYTLKTLLEYARALQTVRQSGVRDYDKYPNGM